MSEGIDIIKLRDETNTPVYAQAHVESVDGIDRIENEIIRVDNKYSKAINDMQNAAITNTGWLDYQVRGDLDKNKMYSGSGFKCGIKQQIVNASKKKDQLVMKSLRVNIRGFEHDTQIAQIPKGFSEYTQVFWARGGNGYQPIMVQVQQDGKIIPRIMVEDINNSANSNWIYAQFTWFE